jgi:hypothetical protein
VFSLAVQVQERRATRGLAAAARLQGQYRNAIKHLERVLEISQQMREYTGVHIALATGLHWIHCCESPSALAAFCMLLAVCCQLCCRPQTRTADF